MQLSRFASTLLLTSLICSSTQSAFAQQPTATFAAADSDAADQAERNAESEAPGSADGAEIDDARLEQCFSSYESAQVQLRDGKLLGAQAAALECSERCPEEIQEECSSLVSQSKRDTPTALPLASTERGSDASGVQLFVDGQEQTDYLGQELPLNPGSHELRFFREEDGWEERIKIVMRRGEKRLQVRVVVPELKAETPPPVEEAPVAEKKRAHPLVIASFVVGGAGFAVAAAGGIAGLSYRSKLNGCSPDCDELDAEKWVRRGRTSTTVADVGLAVGAVGVLTGTALILWGPRHETKAPSASFQLSPTLGGGAALVRGTF